MRDKQGDLHTSESTVSGFYQVLMIQFERMLLTSVNLAMYCKQYSFCDVFRCGTNNSAIFSEIVPEQKRSTIYAFDRSFEGAVAACGTPLVGQNFSLIFKENPRKSRNKPSINMYIVLEDVEAD